MNKHGTIRLKAFETTIKWFVGDFNAALARNPTGL